MAIRPLTDHEFRYRVTGGSFTSWTACTSGNTTDNGGGSYTINNLDYNIAIGDFQVRVKAIGGNPPSSVLSNTVAFEESSLITPVITFEDIDNPTMGDEDIRIIATSTNPDSPIIITSSALSKATLSKWGDTWYVKLISTGAFQLTASQASSEGYNAAVNVVKDVTILANTFIPSSIDGLIAHYDADDIDNTIVSGKMSMLKNKASGDAEDLVQAIDGDRPIVITTTEGWNGINLNGKTISGLVEPNSPLPFTFYIILKQNSESVIGGSKGIFQWGPQLYDSLYNSGDQYEGFPGEIILSSYAQTIEYPSVYQTKWNIISGLFGNAGDTTSYIKLNDHFKWLRDTSLPNTDPISRVILGDADVTVGELLIYDGDLSDVEDANVRKYIRSKKPFDGTKTLLAFGDSIVQGAVTVKQITKGYVPLTANSEKMFLINYGISGTMVYNTTPGNNDFAEVHYFALSLNPQNTIVYIAYGANDAMNYTGELPVWKQKLKDSIQDLLDYGYEPSKIILGTAPYMSFLETMPTFVNLIQEVSEELGVKFFNMFDYGFNNGGDSLLYNYGVEENVHPDDNGHTVYAVGLSEFIENNISDL